MTIPIHHMTHIRNLPQILRSGGLWCDAERAGQAIGCVGIAHNHLKERRARVRVVDRSGQALAAGGVLADYVPFYFAIRSPMLYAIHRQKVEGYSGGQADILYLVSTVEIVLASGQPWCFTDGHAVEAITDFHDDPGHLDTIDWEVIQGRYWASTPEDPDRKRRKQAEFLVHNFVPWNWLQNIGVIDPRREKHVKEMIAEAEHRPEIRLEPSWYY